MKLKLSIVSCGLLILSGCAHYKSRPLKSLLPKKINNIKEEILFNYKIFNKNDSKAYLGVNVIRAGYIPIQISIKNNTKKRILFSPSQISLKTVPAHVVAEAVKDRTTSRIVGWGITGCFIPIFIIPAIVDSAWSVEANEKMLIDYSLKSLSKQIIEPTDQLDGIIFVESQDFHENFTVILYDLDSRNIITCKINKEYKS